MSPLAQTSYILPLTVIRRKRALPIPGQVLVRQGQRVEPQTVVLQANLTPEHVLLNVAAGLGVPAAKATSWMQCHPGERLTQGDMIAASPKGLFQKVFRSPCDGKVMLVRGGMVLVEKEKEPTSLPAIYPGAVVDVVENNDVIIESSGALIECAWGNGKATAGVLRIAMNAADTVLQARDMDVSWRGAVVVSGTCKSVDVFSTGAETGIRGLVMGSMPPAMIPAAQKAPFPVLLTDGFGTQGMNLAAYELLSTSAERDVCLNGQPYHFHEGLRPEVFLPLPATKNLLPPAPREYAPEDLVRVITPPHRGMTGHILRILPDAKAYPGGALAPSAQIRLPDGTQVILPLANIQLLR
ncbi:MAG: hypothetical protein Fur0018_05140 [Anaerolineales bacterium]